MTVPRELEEQIELLKSLIACDDRGSSHSDCSSPEEAEREEKGQGLKVEVERGRETLREESAQE